jgi:superfamily II DNA or RNA helicase/predicted nucleic acid-binding Zn ribbon protein
MQLRPYQLTAVDEIREAFKEAKRVVLCLPTGAGKTVVFSEIVRRVLEKGRRVAIITHRRELLSQAGKLNRCDILMVETLNNQIKRGVVNLSSYDLLVIDEAHIGNFRKILEGFEGFVIGATATPVSKPPMAQSYGRLINSVGIGELIAQGYLCNPITYAMHPVDTSKIASRMGEFTAQGLDDAFNRPKVYEGVVQEFCKRWRDKKAIVFCVNIEATINTAEAFSKELWGEGRVYAVHSKQSAYERADLIEEFTASKYGILVNCGIATTGFDCPDIEVVVVNRATKSVALWLQMVGRGSRPTASKKEFTILDFGENVHRLGFWQEARDWGKAFAGMEQKKGQGVAPVKDCPCCGAVLYASARFCEFCGEVFASEKKAERGSLELMAYEKLNGRYLFEIAKTPADLWELKSRKNYKQAFIERVLYYANYSELRRFWDAKGYTQVYTNRREREFAEGGAVKNFIVKL